MNRRWEYIAELVQYFGLETGVELGVAEGRFSHYLCKHTPVKMWSVDLWEQGENAHESYADWPMDFYYQGFAHAVKDMDCEVLRMSTSDAVEHVPDVDFVFIDADHSYEGVKSDIEEWAPKVKVFAAGHDINLPSVEKAVTEYFGGYGRGPDNVWIAWK